MLNEGTGNSRPILRIKQIKTPQSTITIDECAAKIQSSIIKAYEKSCPLKTAFGVPNTAYWSSELGNLRKRARKAWNYRLTDPDAYRNAIKEYIKAQRWKNDRLGRISVER
jgi:hypothetical protein